MIYIEYQLKLLNNLKLNIRNIFNKKLENLNFILIINLNLIHF